MELRTLRYGGAVRRYVVTLSAQTDRDPELANNPQSDLCVILNVGGGLQKTSSRERHKLYRMRLKSAFSHNLGNLIVLGHH